MGCGGRWARQAERHADPVPLTLPRPNHSPPDPRPLATIAEPVPCGGCPPPTHPPPTHTHARTRPHPPNHNPLVRSSDVPHLALNDGSNGARATLLRFTGGSWSVVGGTNVSTGKRASQVGCSLCLLPRVASIAAELHCCSCTAGAAAVATSTAGSADARTAAPSRSRR